MEHADISPTSPSHVSRLNQTSAKIQRFKLLIKRRWWILLLCATAGLFISAWKVQNQPVVFESYGRLVTGGSITLHDGPRYSENAQHFFGTQKEIIESSEVYKRAEEHVSALNPELELEPVSIDVFRGRDSAIFSVRARGSSPDTTQQMLDAVLREYISYRSDLRADTSNNTIDAITAQIIRLERQAAEAEKNLSEFTDTHSVVVLEEGGNSAATYLAELTSERAKLQTDLELLESLDIDQNIDRRTGSFGGGESADGESTSTGNRAVLLMGPEADYLGAKQELELLLAQKMTLSRDLKPSHPEMTKIDEKITSQRTLIDIYRQQSEDKFKQRRASLGVQIANLDDEITEWEGKALKLSSQLNTHESLKAERDRVSSLAERLTVSLRELNINRNLQQESVSIMDRASGASEAKKDTAQTLVTGAIGGLVVGLLLLFMIDRLDDRINSFAEFQANFTEDVLGQIPEQRAKGRLSLVRRDDDRHLYAEAFRNLRSSLFFKKWVPAAPKTILVTSAVPSEGKTTIAGSLAYTMALSGAKILLIDGDIRRGLLHDLVGGENTTGVSEILTGEVPWQKTVQRIGTSSLYFIPRGSGAEHSSEKYLNGIAERVVSEAREQFDYVICDSAPVLVADDTTTFAPLFDQTLFVIRMSATNARLSAKALDLLYDRQVRIGGVILNRASTSLKEYSYYGYGSYYSKPPPQAANDDTGPKAISA